MEKFVVGYKQSDNNYVYVDSINSYNTAVTLDVNNALEFANETMAKNVAEYINYKNNETKYIPLTVQVKVKEVTK